MLRSSRCILCEVVSDHAALWQDQQSLQRDHPGIEARPASVIEALLEPRPLFTGRYRLASRAYQVLLARSKPRHSPRLQLAALACAAGDLWLSRALARGQGPPLRARLVTDTADTLAWSLATDGPFDTSVLAAVPLSLEIGLRFGAPGILTSLTSASAIASARKLAGRKPGIRAFSWQVLAAIGGAVLGAYATRWSAAKEATLMSASAARVREARHAGADSIAMGADSLLDQLCEVHTGLLHGSQAAAELGWALREHKRELGSSSEGAYLKEVVDAFERMNSASSHVQRDATFNIAPGATTTVLTASQQDFLHGALAKLRLSGNVHMDVRGVDPLSPPGSGFSLVVGDLVIEVPTDTSSPIPPFEPGPVIALLGAISLPNLATRAGGGTPLARCLPISLAFGILGARGFLRRSGARELLWPTFAILELASVLLAGSGAPTTAHGIQRYPSNAVLVAPALMAGNCYDDLTASEQRLLTGAALCAIGIGLLRGPRPVRITHLIVDLLWPYTAFVTARSVGRALARHARDLEAHQERLLERDASAAYRRGRSDVIRLLEKGVLIGRQEIEAASAGAHENLMGDMSAEILEEATRRLDAIEAQLDTMR